MSDQIKFLKIRPVKLPSRAYDFDAGIDFYVPEFTPAFIVDLKAKNPDIFKEDCACNQIYNNAGISAGYVDGCTSNTITFNAGASTPEVEYDFKDKNDTLIKFDEVEGKNYFLLAPHQRILVPSGIKSRMATPGRALIAANKSGVATKYGLVYGAQVVDYLYQGEIHISVINTSTKMVRIYEDMKLIQFLETPVFNSNIEIVDNISSIEFYEGMQLTRGEGGFGSSDKKKNK